MRLAIAAACFCVLPAAGCSSTDLAALNVGLQ